MISNKIKLNQSSVISEPDVHDADVVGWKLLNKTFELYLKTEQGHSFTLKFSGIIQLDCFDYSTQNVVSDIEIHDISKMDFNKFNSLLSSFGFATEFSESLFNLSKNMYMVYLRPSVGAEIRIICESADVI